MARRRGKVRIQIKVRDKTHIYMNNTTKNEDFGNAAEQIEKGDLDIW